MAEEQLLIIGVRHHSPACARRVRDVIERRRPAIVLIEGPSDFNPHMEDLEGAHSAAHSHLQLLLQRGADERLIYAVLRLFPRMAGAGVGAGGRAPSRCSAIFPPGALNSATGRTATPIRTSCTRAARGGDGAGPRLGAEGQDAMWDALAEQADAAALPADPRRLLRPVAAGRVARPVRSRAGGVHGALRRLGAARGVGRPVVLVCGGWHVSGCGTRSGGADGAQARRPFEPPEGARTGSYLVPYAYARLDRFSGYAAGMPSPGYYDAVHEGGLDAAADWAMRRIAKALRDAGQPVSTADQIAWRGHAEALARLRGHRAILRADILDAALCVLVKDALESPAAWAKAGPVGPAAPIRS